MDLLEARIASAMLVEVGVDSLRQTYNFLMDSEIFFFPQKSLSSCSPVSSVESPSRIFQWSGQVKRDMKFLMYDHCSPSTVRSKPFIQIQGRSKTSPHPFLSDHRSPQWSHLPESFSGVARENDATFFTFKNLCFPTEILYPLNLCQSCQG